MRIEGETNSTAGGDGDGGGGRTTTDALIPAYGSSGECAKVGPAKRIRALAFG